MSLQENKKYKKEHVGGELLIDMHLPSSSLLKSDSLKNFIASFYERFTEINVKKEIFYEFPNGGVTYISVLAESHFALHSYPEINLLSVNIYFCSLKTEMFTDIEKWIKNYFQPIDSKVLLVKRGIDEKRKEIF